MIEWKALQRDGVPGIELEEALKIEITSGSADVNGRETILKTP